MITTALSLDEEVAVLDVTASQRAATSSLLQALAAVNGELYADALVVASDHRRTKAASPQEFSNGDGAAAIRLGKDNLLLEFIGGHSRTVDFVDHFRGEHETFDYSWEERWIRDEGYQTIVPPAITPSAAEMRIECG